jgi:ornithine carbamoyltransferase
MASVVGAASFLLRKGSAGYFVHSPGRRLASVNGISAGITPPMAKKKSSSGISKSTAAPRTKTAAGTVKRRATSSRRSMAGRDLLTLTDLTREEVLALFETAAKSKKNIKPFRTALDGKTAILLFEKASLRTRISFETGINKLGGTAIYMDHSAQKIGERESTKDYGKNLERWVDCIIARVYSQRAVDELASFADVPVINALSDRFHPCQGLADLFTLWERPGGLDGVKLAWVGDGNNVCHSLMHAASMLGVDMTVVTPRGYEPAPEVVQESLAFAKENGSTLAFSHDPAIIEGHHAVYTDVWVSMGQADQANERRAAFAEYCVSEQLMRVASNGVTGKRFPNGSLFMHCLPAQRGVEVTDEVIDSPASIVYDQAENRMHAQNALLIHLFGKA